MKEYLSYFVSASFLESFSIWANELPKAGVCFLGFLALLGVISLVVFFKNFFSWIGTSTTNISLLEEGEVTEVKGKAKSYDGECFIEPFTGKKVVFYHLVAGVRKKGRKNFWRYIPIISKVEGNQRLIRVKDESGEVVVANYTFENPLLGRGKKKFFWRKIPSHLINVFPDIKELAIEEVTLASKYYFSLYYLEVDAPIIVTAKANRFKIEEKSTFVLSGSERPLDDFKSPEQYHSNKLLTQDELISERIKKSLSKDFADIKFKSESKFRSEIDLGGKFKQILKKMVELTVLVILFCLFTIPFIFVIYFNLFG